MQNIYNFCKFSKKQFFYFFKVTMVCLKTTIYSHQKTLMCPNAHALFILFFQYTYIFLLFLAEKCQSDEVNSWRVGNSAENEHGESSRGTDFNQPRKKNNSPPRLFSLNKNQMRYSAAVSTNTDDLSASQQSNMAGQCQQNIQRIICCQPQKNEKKWKMYFCFTNV